MASSHRFRALMLPSLGFFGGTWADYLGIPVNRSVQSVTLRLESARPEFLNLRGVLVVRDGKPLQLGPDEFTIAQSSDRPASKLPPQGIDSLTGIHTLRESGPWWSVRFTGPQHVDAVYVFNRRDRLGIRSRSLAVDVTETNGTTCTLHAADSRGYVEDVLHVIERYVGRRWAEADIRSGAQARKWRTDTVRLLNESFRGGSPVPSRADWLKIAALLPTESTTALEGEDWYLLAYGLCAQLKRDPRSRSGVYSYSGILRSRKDLARLEAEFDDVRRALDGNRLQLLKHGVSPLGALRQELSGIEKMFPLLQQDLSEHGLTPMLAYGTLLGARRDGKVMDHDDDFDIMVIVDADTEESFDRRTAEILADLRRRGWRVWENGKHKNCHLGHAEFEGHIDLFFARRHADVVETHMERMTWRGIPARYFDSTREIKLEGKTYPAPRDVDEFLLDRYGAGWKTPDKYHDWRWPLSDDPQEPEARVSKNHHTTSTHRKESS